MTHATTNKEPCAACNEALTYECYWCGVRSLKETWGPGWIRCPRCQRIAPSVAERQEMALIEARIQKMSTPDLLTTVIDLLDK